MTAPVSGTISAAGVGNAVQINYLDSLSAGLLVEVSGNYQGVLLVFEELLKGSGWFGQFNVARDNLFGNLLAPGAVSPLVLPDSGNRAFRFQIPAREAFRVWATSISGGALNVVLTPGPWPMPLPKYAL